MKKNDETITILNEFIEQQNKRMKKGIVFMIIIGILIGGISGVASYSLAAGQVSFTAKDSSWEVDNTEDALNDLRKTAAGATVGTIIAYMGTKTPYGYLPCDGQIYNISDYPRLATQINYNFGSYNYFGGDGETTFAVPDLRGEFLRGTGTNSHTNSGSGANVGIHQTATIQPAIGASDGTYLSMGLNTSLWDGFQNADFLPARNLNNRYISTSGQNSNKRVPWYMSRPTNTSVLFLIKY